MTKYQGANALSAQDARAKALEKAQGALKAKGVSYPMYDPRLPVEENYARLEAYAIQESTLVHQFLNESSSPRPLVVDKVQPKRQYGNSYYDD